MVRTREEKNEYAREYRQNNKEKIAESNRLYNQNNKEQIAEQKKEYYQTPAGKKAEKMKLWRRRGVINVNNEMYNNYIATTHCECCLKEFSSSFNRCLDHDHETGEYRWVICRACNTLDNWKNKI